MKAIRVHAFGEPEVMQLEEIPDPKPGPGQVVVRAHAIGINPVEAYIRGGKYARLPELPYTPGTDLGGVVEAVGPDVEQFAVNDWVYTSGTLTGAYAELALCDLSQVHPLPERASFAQGAAIGVAVGAAWRALFHRGKAQPGETVLIHGATGGVGIGAVQLARAAGLTVIGTAGSPRGRELLREQGAHHVFDHAVTDHPEPIKEVTGGKGVDLILEMLANVNLAKDLTVMARNGRVVIVGSRGTVEIDPRLTMGTELTILGMSLFNATPEEVARMHASLVASLESGALRPVVDAEFPLADAAHAHKVMMEGESGGKIILTPREGE